MSRPLNVQIIELARSLIGDKQHWCRCLLAEDANGLSVYPTSTSAAKRCALGAVIAAAYHLTHNYDAANELAHNALRPHAGISTLVHVNDVRGHTAVLALFNEIIAVGCSAMRLCSGVLIAMVCVAGWTGAALAQHSYSKAVQKACAKDYKAHCGQYGIETEALRLCMDRAGQRLTKTCVDALVAAGEVSKQEVERRKRSGR